MPHRHRSFETPNRLASMQPAMNVSPQSHLRSRTIVFVAAGVVLTWLVLSRSLAAFLADAAPQSALWLDSRQPQALVNLADQALRTATAAQVDATVDNQTPPEDKASAKPQSTSEKLAKYLQILTHSFSRFETVGRNLNVSRPAAPENESNVRVWAQTAITNEPLNARALRILGQLAEADSDDTTAEQLMYAADSLSLHENYASYWLMRNSLTAGDLKSALYYADILLRTNPQSVSYVVPVLAQISEDKGGAPLVKAVLSDNPPWRSQFISLLPQSVADPRTPLDLLLALRTSSVPPTAQDIEPYLKILIGRKFYSLAYYTWLQFLPPEGLRRAGLLFNGDFEAAPTGLPFDWKITPGAGVTIDVVSRPDGSGKHALLVAFQYGRVDYYSVTELVMLPPGTYQFSGEYKGELVGPRGMKWRVVCADGAITDGGESAMITGLAKDWKSFAFTFTVPDKDCAAQYVRLDLDARMTSEQLISGSILFDDLQITHTASPSAAGG